MTHPTPSDVTHQALQKARDAADRETAVAELKNRRYQTTLDNLPEGV